jgi:hypothetical protein
VFDIMAIVGGPSMLVAMLSADGSAGQSTRVKQLAEAAVLCGPLSVARYLWLAALLREARFLGKGEIGDSRIERLSSWSSPRHLGREGDQLPFG